MSTSPVILVQVAPLKVLRVAQLHSIWHDPYKLQPIDLMRHPDLLSASIVTINTVLHKLGQMAYLWSAHPSMMYPHHAT